VLQAFPGSFPASVQCETVGNPVRPEIAALPLPLQRFNDRAGPLRLLVLGGSLGALALNRAVPAALSQLAETARPRVRHQTGDRTIDAAREAYRHHGVDAELVPYIEDMAAAYAWADLVICRAGALTVAELEATGLGAIFVPFPYAVDDHQTANAQAMVHAGAAAILAEKDLGDSTLASILAEWLSSRDGLRVRAEKARGLAIPDALERITGSCLALAGATS
jgi:UDP-N-acetylglucosamine--N-acetylmuramyl-(pentapeptide) pyrophosphoryl-undecaprenol N-acetylglucosamine transferase